MYLDRTFGLRLSLSELAERKLSEKVTSPIVLRGNQGIVCRKGSNGTCGLEYNFRSWLPDVGLKVYVSKVDQSVLK